MISLPLKACIENKFLSFLFLMHGWDNLSRYDVKKGRPVLAEYMNRVKEDLNPHYDDVHKVVYMMTKKFGGKVPELKSKDDNYKIKM